MFNGAYSLVNGVLENGCMHACMILNLLIVRSLMHDVNDLIHASTALTEHVDVFMTRNIEDFVGLQRYFLVWPPEEIIEEFNVEECIAKKM